MGRRLKGFGVRNKKEELERLEKANDLIKVIASCGREFFKHDGFVSYLELSETGRVFFIDYYTKKRIYTHRSNVHWNGFTSGGTLKYFVVMLRRYIKNDCKIPLFYFSSEGWNCEQPWGYGGDLEIVRDAAVKLDISK